MKNRKTITITLIVIGIIVIAFILFYFIKNATKGKMIELTFTEYNEKIENKDTFVLFLWQTGCSHCEKFEPVLKRVVNKNELEIYTINLAKLGDSEYSKIQNKTFIKGTPATVYIKDGVTQSTKLVGNKPETQIIDFFKEYKIIE